MRKYKKPYIIVIKILVVSFFLLVGLILVIGFVFKTKEYVIGNGKIIIDDKRNVYSHFNGVINDVQKRFGDLLNEGEEVLTIINIDKKQNLKNNEVEMMNLEIELRRLEAEIIANGFELKNITQEIQKEEKEISTMQLKKEMAEFNFKSGDISKLDLQIIKNESEKIRIEIESKQLEKNKIESKQNELEKQKKALMTKKTFYENEFKDNEIFMETISYKKLSINEKCILITENIGVKKNSEIKKGEVLFSVANTNSLKAEVFINEKDINKIKIGQKVKVTLEAIPFERFSILNGEVEKIYPQSMENKTFNIIKISLKNFDSNIIYDKYKDRMSLKDGMNCKVKIEVSKEQRNIYFILEKLFN